MAFREKRKYDTHLYRAIRKYGKEHFFIKEAATKYNKDGSAITKICKGKTNYLRIANTKVTFRYKSEIYIPKYTVECFTDSLGTIESFVDASDGAKKYKIDPSALTRCCKGKSESAGKYNNEKLKWRYVK